MFIQRARSLDALTIVEDVTQGDGEPAKLAFVGGVPRKYSYPSLFCFVKLE
jgi:hypothetical protein